MSKKINIEKEIIVSIFEKSHSINRTAKELGISWDACARILKEYGIETQPKSGSVDPYNLFDEIRTEEDAYWLGIMYTDGWIRSDCNKIGLGSVDLDLIQKWKEYTKTPNKIQVKRKEDLIGKNLPEGRICRTARDFYTIEFSSKQTKQNLIALGCVPKKSKILQCPTEQQVPDKLLWHFFRGCIDGDGWIRYQPRYEIGLCGTQHFIEVLMTRLKILHYGKLYKNGGLVSYKVYKRELVEKILNKLYKDAHIYMDRKHNSYLKYIGCSSI